MDIRGLKPEKAYKNMEFMNSAGARHIRIMCEYQQPWDILQRENVKGTLLFFGSARSKTQSEWDAEKKTVDEAMANATSDDDLSKGKMKLDRLMKGKWLIPWHEKVRILSKKLTEWCLVHMPSEESGTSTVVVCTGGGPGMMEAANQGAFQAGPKAKSMGMGISLPFEPRLNTFVRPDALGFEFHYFFTRKFWMVYNCKGLIVAPGGVGTCDELFEVMTLLQTGKISKQASFPIVLLCKEFWQTVVNWAALVKYGTISQHDVDRLHFVDSIDDAFAIITSHLQLATVKGVPLLSPKSPKFKAITPPTPTKTTSIDILKL